jgi:hypothetical protein
LTGAATAAAILPPPRRRRDVQPGDPPAAIIDSSPRSQQLDTSRNVGIQRSCRPAVRFIAPLSRGELDRPTRVFHQADN